LRRDPRPARRDCVDAADLEPGKDGSRSERFTTHAEREDIRPTSATVAMCSRKIALVETAIGRFAGKLLALSGKNVGPQAE
jgi:hypothetical protein